MIKVLNLYAGIGGNRKLWNNVDVTAVEYDPQIAKVYEDLYPNDKMVVGDAHAYLLENFKEYDFIWASPPCPSHSCIRKMGCNPNKTNPEGQNKPIYPDMKLYEEIILLQYYFKGKFCVENVMPYYDPLIKAKKLDRHLFWTNYPLNEKRFSIERKHHQPLELFVKQLEIDLKKYGLPSDKQRYMYRNCVDSGLGKYVFDMAYHEKQGTIKEFFN